jgi:hypothetical protein
MQMYYGGMWQEYSRTLDYSSVMDGFKVRLRFHSTSNGTVTYSYASDLKISSTETLNVENETINVKQGLAATVDIDLSQYINSSNFKYSKLYSFKINGNIGDVDAEVSYNFIIITGDELTVSPSTDNWVDFTGDYSTSYFEKGNDFNLGLTIISDRDEVINDIYMVCKMYYATINEETGEFTISLTTRSLAKAADFCGVRSGRNTDKFGEMKLTPLESVRIGAPGVAQSPVVLECSVKQILRLGSHDMFIAEVVNVSVEERYLDDKGRLELEKADLIAYSHGEYFALGDKIGKFGYSVRKKTASAGSGAAGGRGRNRSHSRKNLGKT